MRVRIHLVAMPWAPPDTPSIQLGSLKAHLDRTLRRQDDCRTYSAFFSVLHDLKGRAFRKFFHAVNYHGEYVYLPLYVRRFGPLKDRGRPGIARLPEAMRKRGVEPLSWSVLNGLERATRTYLDEHVAPNLIAGGLNLVGFTLTYDQVYASLYAAAHLQRSCAGRNLLFVFGGSGASLPPVYELLSEVRVPGVVVVGEGERKLELLARTFAGLPRARAGSPLAAAAGLDAGIIVIGEKVALDPRNPGHDAAQVEDLSELAMPDYDEYFAALRRACADEETYAAFCASTCVPVEGSRGCFRRCDFCALNRTWRGFRARSADQVVRGALALTWKYRTSRVEFIDSVCDTWAEDYARTLVREGIRLRSDMELRADHPERFWALLALAGVERVQVGVEALSSALLSAMGKGTTAVRNLAAHKYLTELGIGTANNLITHHPASRLEDVRETRRILGQIPHWAPFKPTEFQLMAGSALYERLSGRERGALRMTRRFRLSPGTVPYALEYTFAAPTKLRPEREVRRAWSAFERHYERARARQEDRRPRLDVLRVAPDRLRLTDTRDGSMACHDLSGPAARIYDVCHRGVKLGEIAGATGLPPPAVGAALARFLRAKLVLRVDDDYLSLATRPRDELLQGLFASREACAGAAGGRCVARES
jgi:radical SAM superfamily enzyme YgiQ (UPF0313 family)